MNFSRKQFLQLSGGTLGALALSPLANDLLAESAEEKLKTFGLQLYTLRDDLLKDPKNILQQVASFGYKQIESYEGPNGMFWGMSNNEFKKLMDGLGMTMIASHCNVFKDFEKKADEAAAIGMKYLLSSSYGKQKTKDDYKKLSDQFNQSAEICKKNGIRFAYHGEDSDFMNQDGFVPHDYFMKQSDPSAMDFEMDFYWVIVGGEDPINLLKKYPGRFRLCHIKDRVKGSAKREDTCDLGVGSINFREILKIARKNGMQYYIAEQENYPGSTPLASVKVDGMYMKRLRF